MLKPIAAIVAAWYLPLGGSSRMVSSETPGFAARVSVGGLVAPLQR